ncbi:MAG: F0F1 ATP synthase subunit delta [Candidatus Omnitrophica bacterium]|nr:F0F1 ATP synthase subunit delta [Candidatus Omnitrophota bacterium]
MFLIAFIVINLVTFLAMVLVFRRVMISSSYEETSRLQALNLENAQKATELQEKIEEAEKQYKEKLLKAEDEIRRLKERATQEAETVREQILTKAKGEKDRMIDQAIGAKKKLREEIENELLDKGLEFSRNILVEILSEEHQKLVHEGLLEEILSGLEKIDPAPFKGAAIKQCRVRTPRGLDARRKEWLAGILSQKTGENISLEESIDKDLIAGVIVHIGSFMVDGSLAARFKKASEHIRHGG